MQLIARGDYALSQLTGSEFDLVSKVDPQLGKIGVTLVLNGKYFVERERKHTHTQIFHSIRVSDAWYACSIFLFFFLYRDARTYSTSLCCSYVETNYGLYKPSEVLSAKKLYE